MKLFDLFKKKKNEPEPQPRIPEGFTGFEPEEDSDETKLFVQDTTTMTLDEAMVTLRPDFAPQPRTLSQEELRNLVLFAVAIGDTAGSQYEGVPYPGQDIQTIMSNASSRHQTDANKEGAYPVYEGYKTIDLLTEFNHITDDTILTIAIYKATQKIKALNLQNEDEIVDMYTKYLRKYHHAYPNAGYAGGFDDWAWSETPSRNFSYGNGSCMRVSGIAILFDDIDDVIRYAYYSALPSHSHKEGIKGAVCTAVIYWMLIHGASKNDVLKYLEQHYPNDGKYDIHAHTTLEDLVNINRVNPWATVSVICQTSVTESVINFVESTSFEECVRNSYRYMCDRDTIGAISAPMAALFYKDLTIQGWNGIEVAQKYLGPKLVEDINS